MYEAALHGGPTVTGTVRNFVCEPGIMGSKEKSYGPTQRALDT
jgi:hypothetical protein